MKTIDKEKLISLSSKILDVFFFLQKRNIKEVSLWNDLVSAAVLMVALVMRALCNA